MPSQETFLVERVNDVVVEVLKTYDRSYGREVFRNMSAEALKHLAAALRLTEKYEASDIPSPDAIEYEDFLWEELSDSAREDVRLESNLFSFFVVRESKSSKANLLAVGGSTPECRTWSEILSERLVASH